MLPVAAYADRLSLRPGETIRFHGANTTGQAVEAKVVRVVCADANPKGPGIVVEPVASEITKVNDAVPQDVPHGSYFVAGGLNTLSNQGQITFACLAYPTIVEGKRQCIASATDDAGNTVFELVLNTNGLLDVSSAVHGASNAPQRIAVRRWHVIWLTLNTSNGELRAGSTPLDRSMLADASENQITLNAAMAESVSVTQIMLGARSHDKPTAHFNGKLERPRLWARVLSDAELQSVNSNGEAAGAVHAWDFSSNVASATVADEGSGGTPGRLVNTPVRAVTGSKWTGQEMRFSDAPEQFAAVHLHDDDLDNCHWPVIFEWTVPEGTRSSVYALQLTAGDAQENVPFHVVPPKGKRTAKIAVLASTFTYVIYANHTRPEWDWNADWKKAWLDQAAEWGCYPHNPGDHREFAMSTYNFHPDGSGISLSSWNRPMLTVRVGYLTYPYEEIRGSGLRHFPADSHLNAWLESQGYDYDIVTDWELHHEGVSVLDGYDVVMTGSHPEYHTRETLDALQAYRDGGGRFCYMGGNGFYWKVALSTETDGTIEIRRGEGGIRAWAAEPGEYYNQFDGEYGGLWRRNGRPPQNLAGVGFTAQGNFSGSYYRRRAEANDPRVSWMFKGLSGETFGDHGLSAHGAAGFELDRADKRLGTPEHAVVVASSENHPPEAPWILVPEEMLTHIQTWAGQPAKELIRADMTFFETPAGGAVFSTGSITFCGSLLTNGSDNDVSSLMKNVVDRFLDPTPFEMPQA